MIEVWIRELKSSSMGMKSLEYDVMLNRIINLFGQETMMAGDAWVAGI